MHPRPPDRDRASFTGNGRERAVVRCIGCRTINCRCHRAAAQRRLHITHIRKLHIDHRDCGKDDDAQHGIEVGFNFLERLNCSAPLVITGAVTAQDIADHHGDDRDKHYAGIDQHRPYLFVEDPGEERRDEFKVTGYTHAQSPVRLLIRMMISTAAIPPIIRLRMPDQYWR